jgi:hypothetical protein
MRDYFPAQILKNISIIAILPNSFSIVDLSTENILEMNQTNTLYLCRTDIVAFSKLAVDVRTLAAKNY